MVNFPDADIAAFFNARRTELLDPVARIAITFTAEFRVALPSKGGVYALFHEDTLFYVGETTSIRQRIGTHLRNPENHVLALKIARLLHDEVNGAGSAGSTKKFPEAHKEITRTWIQQNLRIAFAQLTLGRKELEELLIDEFKPEFNKRYPRLPTTTASASVAA